jgi:hypothetical protein
MAVPVKKTTIPSNVKQPTDRQAGEDTVDPGFSFEVGGETFTLKPAKDNFTRGFYRRIRKESEVDQMFSIVELLAEDDATLDAFDAIPDDEFKTVFTEPFNAYFKAINGGSTVGESSAS